MIPQIGDTPKMLSALQIKNAPPKKKPYKLSDGGGPHLLISPKGSKLWRLKYRYLGKEKLLSLDVIQTSVLQKQGRRENPHGK